MKYVSLIQDGLVKTSEQSRFPCSYSSELELAELVSMLIDEGFFFVDEPSGWSPAAIAQLLQEKGFLDKAFTAVTWQGPSNYRTYQVPQC